MGENRCVSCMQANRGFPVCLHCANRQYTPYPTHLLPLGTVLNQRYMVGETLDAGRFDVTYIGWDRQLQRPVVIKEYFPIDQVGRSMGSPEVVLHDRSYGEKFVRIGKRFLELAKLYARLGAAGKLTNIARVYDVFTANSTAYAVMEYIGGIELRSYVNEWGGRLTLQQTLRLLTPVMQDLEELHRNGIVYRELRIENLEVLPDGTGKLIDFGNAYGWLHDRHDIQEFELRYQHFAPPEQYRAGVGPWSDVYAMSAMAYYCLCGIVPPSAEERKYDDRESDWKWGWDLVDSPQREVLQKGLALKSADRIQTMAELRQGLSVQQQKNDPQ